MRYTDTREKSAEFLRAAIQLMGQHVASFNPVSFAVWYEHSAGANASLSKAISERLAAKEVFDDETTDQLFRDHIADPGDSEIDGVSEELQRTMARLVDKASLTGQRADAFGVQLAELSATLATNDAAALSVAIEKTAQGTAEMTSSALSLEQEAVASRGEIESLRSQLTRARNEALLDTLTGILNRRGLDLRLNALLAEKVGSETSHCLIMLDIDHFKRVNDTHGHVVGDRVIQALGKVLKGSVQPGQVAARYGGEEFAILMPNSSVEDSMRVAAALRTRVKALSVEDRRRGGPSVSVTISLGVTALRSGDDASRFIARADGALYASKQNGRDRVSFA